MRRLFLSGYNCSVRPPRTAARWRFSGESTRWSVRPSQCGFSFGFISDHKEISNKTLMDLSIRRIHFIMGNWKKWWWGEKKTENSQQRSCNTLTPHSSMWFCYGNTQTRCNPKQWGDARTGTSRSLLLLPNTRKNRATRKSFYRTEQSYIYRGDGK